MSENNNQIVDVYTNMRNKVFAQMGKRKSSNNIPLDLYIEWDRLRMVLNPRARISQSQLKIQENCRWEC